MFPGFRLGWGNDAACDAARQAGSRAVLVCLGLLVLVLGRSVVCKILCCSCKKKLLVVNAGMGGVRDGKRLAGGDDQMAKAGKATK